LLDADTLIMKTKNPSEIKCFRGICTRDGT
jgi:hypothetical protein